MSTRAPLKGAQVPAPPTWERTRVRSSSTRALTAPVAGSDRMSDRLSRSYTKYGPSVRAGVTTHCAFVETVPVEGAPELLAEGELGEEAVSPPPPQLLKKPTATSEPNAWMAWRRPGRVLSPWGFIVPGFSSGGA